MKINIEDIKKISDMVCDEVNKIIEIEVAIKDLRDIIKQEPTYINSCDTDGCIYEISKTKLISWYLALKTAYNLITKTP